MNRDAGPVGAGVRNPDSDQGRWSARLGGSDQTHRRRARISCGSSRTMATDCRSGSVGLGARMASGDACDRQITHRAQSCAGWSGFCCAGCVPSSAWQIGTSPTGQRRCPAAPARSWRGEGSGTRRQAATRQTRPPVSALEEESGYSAQSIAAQPAHPTCQSGTNSLVACCQQADGPDLSSLWLFPGATVVDRSSTRDAQPDVRRVKIRRHEPAEFSQARSARGTFNSPAPR